MKSYEKILPELEGLLKNKYQIEVNEIEQNDESTDGNVFIVSSQNEKYVIKIYDDIEKTKAMTSLHLHLVSVDLNIPKIILTNDDEPYITLSNENYVVVYSFMEGSQLAWNKELRKIDNHLVGPIAKTFRSFHSATNSGNEWGLIKIPFGNEKSIERCSALHFDVTKNNIFVNKDKQNEIGLIDFDDAKYGPSVCDVSIAVANLFFSKSNGVDLNGAKQFIDEYYCGDTELKKKELPLIKSFAIQWIEYILDGNEFDTSTTESFEVRRQLIDENLFLDTLFNEDSRLI